MIHHTFDNDGAGGVIGARFGAQAEKRHPLRIYVVLIDEKNEARSIPVNILLKRVSEKTVNALPAVDSELNVSTVLPPQTFKDLVGYIERGEIKSALAASYPLKDMKEAQQAFIDKKHTGNIVVIP